MIEDKILYLYHTDFCAAATEALAGAVTVTAAGGLAGGVFSKKPSALLLAGVDPKETMPIRQKGDDGLSLSKPRQGHPGQRS